MLILLLACTTELEPPPDPQPDVTGWEGFYALDSVDSALLTSRGIKVDPATLAGVAPRVAKLIIDDGTRGAFAFGGHSLIR